LKTAIEGFDGSGTQLYSDVHGCISSRVFQEWFVERYTRVLMDTSPKFLFIF
jgi:hypothetical protein